MALSEMAARKAKATGKAYTLGDIDGLSLAVTAQGSRSWHFRYCWAGKQKLMSPGTYPETGLREARALRDQARALLAKGINLRSIVSTSARRFVWPTNTTSKRCTYSGSNIASWN